jgi:tol-pal system protein YbgF
MAPVTSPAPNEPMISDSDFRSSRVVASSSGDRVSRLEQQVQNLEANGSSAKVEALQNEVQMLRGQVEDLNHQLQQMQNQQKSMYTDLDKRMSAPTVTTSVPTPPASAVANEKPKSIWGKPKTTTAVVTTTATKTIPEPNVAEEQQIYQTAYDFIKAKKYNEAITALQGMLKKYPAGQFAANAHYWLGELYGLLNKNEQSATEFSTVVKNYTDSPKVSDAQLKLGLIFAAQFKWIDAKSAFKKVINRYPGTATARLASEQLRQIKLAGH